MNTSNTYRIEVLEDTDFLKGWHDAAVPYIDFMFDQENLEECEYIDGQYFATYKTYVLTKERNVEIVKADGTKQTLTILAGEYGLKS